MIPPVVQPGDVFQRVRMPNAAGVTGKTFRVTSVSGDLAQLEWIDAATGSVATDGIWDAAGDLVVGSGANTAARLAIASTGVLSVVSSTAAWSNLINVSQVAAPTAAPDRAEGTAGNLTGTYYYTISFVTAVGETEVFDSPQAITVTAKRVELSNIQLGPAGTTARKIYRGLNSGYEVKYVATIADNTTTTYSDNIADGSVTVLTTRMNTTGGYVKVNGTVVMAADPARTMLGNGQVVGSGIENTTIGNEVGTALTTGYWLTGVGSECLKSVTTGFENSGVGFRALTNVTTGFYNAAIGAGALTAMTVGSQNTGLGYSSGSRLTSGSSNVFVGMGSGQNLTESNNTIAIGVNAAVYRSDGATSNTYANLCVFIGDHCRSASSDTNAIVIGSNAVSLGDNITVIGNVDTVRTRIMGTTENYGIANDAISTFARLLPSGTSTSRGKGISLDINAQPTDSNTTFVCGQLYSIFDGTTYGSARTTLRVVDDAGGFDDVLTVANSKVGINTTAPAVALDVVGAIAATSTVTGSNLSGTNTGDQTSVSGNAGTATALATSRTIFGVSFNGTANVTGSPSVTNIALAGYTDFTEITVPATPGATVIRMWAEDESGFAHLHYKDGNGLVYEIARDNIHTVRNNSGATLAKGKWVYVTGSTGVAPTVALARADSASTVPVFGIVVAAITNNSFGQVMQLGDMIGIDTSAFIDGDVLYLSASTAGDATTTIPTGTNIVQRIGVVVKSSVGAGIISVFIGAELNPALTQTLANKTLVAPALGTPSSGTLTNCTFPTGVKSKVFGVVFDGGGSAPTANTKRYWRAPWAGTITKATLLADVSGSAVIDVWKDTYANYPPTVADTITASAKPTLSAATKAEDATLTGWTTSVSAGDVFGFNLDSVTTCTVLTLEIEMNVT